MTPTAKLRWVERSVPAPEYGENMGKIVRVLQQWWDHAVFPDANGITYRKGEWKDVELGEET